MEPQNDKIHIDYDIYKPESSYSFKVEDGKIRFSFPPEKTKQLTGEIANSIKLERKNIKHDGELEEDKSLEKNDIDGSEKIVPTEVPKVLNSANNQVLVEVLSPQVIKNEIKKREHKDKLLEAMKKFLTFQFIFTACLVAFVCTLVLGGGFFNRCTPEMAKLVFTFVGAYMTSVVVELIAILNYIAQKVFDTSVSDLLATFKAEEKKQEEK